MTLQNLFDLTGKVVIITGGAGFLGLAHAEAILEMGGIAILLDIDPARIADCIGHLTQSFPRERVHGLVVDVTQPDLLRSQCGVILQRFGKIDALINNAANNPTVSKSGSLTNSNRFENVSLEQWNQDLAVGLTGAFLCCQVFGAAMAVEGQGVIVNISSDLGIISPDQRLYVREGLSEDEQDFKPVTYSVVKTGILGLTRYLSTYWASKNIRVNSLALGGVFNYQPKDFVTQLSSRIPLGRMAARDEYKGCIVFLCSDASSYMTGATVVVDGGRTIW